MTKQNTIKEIATKVAENGTESDYTKKPIGADAENVDRSNGETVEESLVKVENSRGSYADDGYGLVKLLSPNTPPPKNLETVGIALSAIEKDKTTEGTLAYDIEQVNNKLTPLCEHSYTETIEREASCTETGEKSYTCTKCGHKYKILTAMVPHNFVDEICTVCGKKNDPYETAPSDAVSNWNYTLDDVNKTITLKKYTGNEEDVIVYENYEVNGETYKAKFNDDASGMFQEKNIIKTINFSPSFDTFNVTDMHDMFSDCNSLTSLDLNSFDTSNVTDMRGMFYNCSSLTSVDLSSFDTSNVTNMNNMFHYCELLISLDLSSFDTSNVAYMWNMFTRCKSLTSLDLSSFDTSNVINMRDMFYLTNNLKTIYVSRDKWITSQANTTDMFLNCGTSEVTYK